MKWTVLIHNKVTKGLRKLHNKDIVEQAFALIRDLEENGPLAVKWPHFGKLNEKTYHCHLRGSRRPTYVAVWQMIDKHTLILEVIYVGTHEKAPY